MTITTDELRKLLDQVTPGEWMRGRMESYEMDGTPFRRVYFDDGGEAHIRGGNCDDNATLIALAPTLARRVIAAEKLVEALRQSELTTEELCRGQSPENQCWVVLGEIRAALAEYEATK